MIAAAISVSGTLRADGAIEAVIVAAAMVAHGDPPTLHSDNEDYDAEFYLALLRWDADVLDRVRKRELKGLGAKLLTAKKNLLRKPSRAEFNAATQLNDNLADID